MKKSPSYTMRDVARLARVSVTTVSAIVNERGGVSPELTQRVEDAMATLDYHPNEVARSLRVNRTSTIGMVVPDVSNFFFNDILAGAESKTRQLGFSVLLCDSHEDSSQERELLAMLVRRRVDGILLASTEDTLVESRLSGRRPPIVCFDREPRGFRGGVVLVDNILASFEAARHLIELGHERIGVIAGPQTILTGAQRLAGFRRALEEAHLALPEEYVRATSFATEPAYSAGLELLQLPNPPTAVFACNNRITMGLMRALRHLGLRCPQDVSVLGFDDFEWSELFSPRLTTVVQPSHQMGEVAAEMLIRTLMGSDQRAESGERHCEVLKAELRVRESTAPPGAQTNRAEYGGQEARAEGMVSVAMDRGAGGQDK